MSFTLGHSVKDADYFLGDLFDSIIGEVAEDIETVDTGDIEIENTAPPDVDPLPDNSPTPTTMVYSVIIWGDIRGDEAVFVFAKPKIGCLLVEETIIDKEKWVLIPFFSTDIDANTNVWR